MKSSVCEDGNYTYKTLLGFIPVQSLPDEPALVGGLD